MRRIFLSVIRVAVIFALVPQALAAPGQDKNSVSKHRISRHWHGYGFLPGYRPPDVIARERAEHHYHLYGPQYYGPAWPGFYRGRWNGGGFGPCWTQTPIGPMWNCGQ